MPAQEGQFSLDGPLVAAQERLVVPAGHPDQLGARRPPGRPDRGCGQHRLVLVADQDQQRAPDPGRVPSRPVERKAEGRTGGDFLPPVRVPAVRIERRVPATVFHPAPNVESAIAVLRRTGPPPEQAVVDLVHAAFAHRRKALAGSLALAPGAPPGIRERARAALEEMGHPADARAERLSPEELAALAERLAP